MPDPPQVLDQVREAIDLGANQLMEHLPSVRIELVATEKLDRVRNGLERLRETVREPRGAICNAVETPIGNTAKAHASGCCF